MSGQSFGIEPTSGHISIVNAAVGPMGDEEAFFHFSDAGLLNVELTLGKTVIGLALLDTCVPECGLAGDGSTADEERRTTVFHTEVQEEERAIRKRFGPCRGFGATRPGFSRFQTQPGLRPP